MKSVLISIQPKWCEKICSGEKTIEVRKNRPKLETPFKCYIYCTQTKTIGDIILCKSEENAKLFGYNTVKGINKGFAEKEDIKLKGKVIGEFVCDRIDTYLYDQAFDESMGVFIDKFGYDILSGELEQTCLSYEEFEKYGKTNNLYGWHISDLKIYDKPKELSEFYVRCNIPESKCKLCDNCYDREYCYGRHYAVKKITRPPQSWCYVETGE